MKYEVRIKAEIDAPSYSDAVQRIERRLSQSFDYFRRNPDAGGKPAVVVEIEAKEKRRK